MGKAREWEGWRREWRFLAGMQRARWPRSCTDSGLWHPACEVERVGDSLANAEPDAAR